MSIIALPDAIDDCLLDALSPRGMLRYSRTCKTAYYMVQDYMKRAFRVDRLLSRYFSPAEITHFRELQFVTGALISGSTALQFLDRDTYPDSDLDVYVQYRFIRLLTEWLVEIGYKYKPLSDSTGMATLDAAFTANPPEQRWLTHPANIFGEEDYTKSTLVFNFENRDQQRTIQLITSFNCPVQCILDFHSTCVMNVVAYDKAYSFFPKATFEERRSLRRYREGDPNRDLAMQKYTRRGWSMIGPSPTQSQPLDLDAFPVGERYVGDRACWTVQVHPALELPPGIVEGNSWHMSISSVHYLTPIMITAAIMSTRELRFAYTLSPHEGNVAKDHIWPLVLSLVVSSGTSDADAYFVHALKMYRDYEDKEKQKAGGH